MAYDQIGDFSHASTDYINTIQLAGDLKNINGDVFYKLSRTYEALGRPCDAITPLETYISLEPVKRRTPQISKIISEYAAKGNCDDRYAIGTARVPFAGSSDVRILPVVINGVEGNFVLDTGATFVSITSRFAAKARVVTESENQVIMKTVGGKLLAEIGYADSISIGKAEASGVVVAVNRGVENPFGSRVDGLLGMSFLSRFNVTLSPNALELAAIRLR
jgi:aspartyl protease family protein